jgi:hypothetical protein
MARPPQTSAGQGRAGRRAPRASAGTTYTQWCDHDTGETSRAVPAHRQMPRSSSRRAAATAAAMPSTATAPAATSQSAVEPGPAWVSRSTAPLIDWFTSRSGPSPGRANRPPQYAIESRGSSTNPTVTVATNAVAATPAAR